MTIYFGLELDDLVYPQVAPIHGGTHYVGPHGLLQLLESHLGLIGHPNNNNYLRIEQYRQALMQHSETQEGTFYQASFIADQFAAATELLSRRDELLLSGWDFALAAENPVRLQTLAEIEALLIGSEEKVTNPTDTRIELAAGFADRFIGVLQYLEKRKQPIKAIYLNENYDLLPCWYQRLFNMLVEKGATLTPLENTKNTSIHSDLTRFQQALRKELERGKKYPLQEDGSLLILRSKRETDAASYLARLFRHNPEYRPVCLIPEKSRSLDNALIQEGLPSMGILSASLARPSLQILKLITVFLWHPIDPFKIMEFVSLAVKPLEAEFANRIAAEMARTPGMNGDGWRAMVARYFDDLEERAKFDKSLNVSEIRKQFNYWFNRTRYDIATTVPKHEVIEIFAYLQTWAYQEFDENGGKNTSLLVLSEQAKRIKELLEALPETQLTHLELERIVRTIYEPSPVVFQEKEVAHLAHVHYSSALIGEVDDLLWWNFTQSEPNHFFSRWYQKERDYLAHKNIPLQTPEDENALLLWQRKRPVLHTQNRLILVIPHQVEGKEVHPHPLLGDLEALFGDLDAITLNVDTQEGLATFQSNFNLPLYITIKNRVLGNPKPFLEVPAISDLAISEQETFSSLNSLFYYPYQWIFRYKLRLVKSSILSVVQDNTLMGNLAHRFFEKMFEEDIQSWKKPDVSQWIDQQAPDLLAREGAVLLMYGREPEKVSFINRIKYAAWSLISILQKNEWGIKGSELPLAGNFKGIPIKGIADLVLEKGNELAIVDLKWRGAARRERDIKNEEDLQLVLYSKLLTEDQDWAHTSYFILEKGEMIARNHLAFQDIKAVTPDADHRAINERIYNLMEETFNWRMGQIGAGQLEIRCEHTRKDLEDTYGAELMDVLEMKKEDSYFDDYRTLINLVE